MNLYQLNKKYPIGTKLINRKDNNIYYTVVSYNLRRNLLILELAGEKGFTYAVNVNDIKNLVVKK